MPVLEMIKSNAGGESGLDPGSRPIKYHLKGELKKEEELKMGFQGRKESVRRYFFDLDARALDLDLRNE